MPRQTQITTRRREQLEEVSGIVQDSGTKLTAYKAQKDQYKLLLSVASGLYEEVDKVSKKAPAEPVTNLVYEEANQIIKEAKELAKDDPYMQRLKQFVAAGENPPHRDVVVALKLLLQGLDRFREHLDELQQAEGQRNYEAKSVESALKYYLQNGTAPDRDTLRDMNTPAPPDWLGMSGIFDFGRLDRMDLVTYFGPDPLTE